MDALVTFFLPFVIMFLVVGGMWLGPGPQKDPSARVLGHAAAVARARDWVRSYARDVRAAPWRGGICWTISHAAYHTAQWLEGAPIPAGWGDRIRPRLERQYSGDDVSVRGLRVSGELCAARGDRAGGRDGQAEAGYVSGAVRVQGQAVARMWALGCLRRMTWVFGADRMAGTGGVLPAFSVVQNPEKGACGQETPGFPFGATPRVWRPL